MTHRRTRTVASIATAALLLAVAACGDDSDDDPGEVPATEPGADAAPASSGPADDTPADSAPADSEAVGDGVFPVTVEHALGTTVVDAEPQRVVTVGLTDHDFVLSVGVVPVGVTEWYGDQPDATWPWAQDELGDADPEVLSNADGIEYERIAALEPDLIIGTNAGLDAESYALLTDIAPTIAHPVGAPLYFSPWDAQADVIGRALGRGEQMATVVDDVRSLFADAAAAHPEFAGRSVAFLQNAIYEGSAIAYQEGLSTAFLTDLGFEIPAVLDEYETDGGQAYIPLESLAVLDDADVLLWATETPDDRTALEQEPLYLGLEEVREGRLVFTDDLTAGAIYFTSPLSLPYVLEQLVPALASTIAGDGPATIGSPT